MKYPCSVDRAKILRHCGSILIVDMVALGQVKEKTDGDQQQQEKKIVSVDRGNKDISQSSRTS